MLSTFECFISFGGFGVFWRFSSRRRFWRFGVFGGSAVLTFKFLWRSRRRRQFRRSCCLRRFLALFVCWVETQKVEFQYSQTPPKIIDSHSPEPKTGPGVKQKSIPLEAGSHPHSQEESRRVEDTRLLDVHDRWHQTQSKKKLRRRGLGEAVSEMSCQGFRTPISFSGLGDISGLRRQRLRASVWIQSVFTCASPDSDKGELNG